MTYTVLKTEIIEKSALVLTQVAYTINGNVYLHDVYHEVFNLTEQAIIDKIVNFGNAEENRLNAIEEAKLKLPTFNL